MADARRQGPAGPVRSLIALARCQGGAGVGLGETFSKDMMEMDDGIVGERSTSQPLFKTKDPIPSHPKNVPPDFLMRKAGVGMLFPS